MFASRFSEKYLRLAFFTELLALFLASLNCFQIEGIGCFKAEVFILTLKWRKKPFLPRKKKSVIRAIAHILLGVNSSATITVSPTVSFLLGRNHFWRSCSKGRYFYFQRPQKTFVKILNFSPSSPGISVVFLLTALAVEINFGELRILEHRPPTQAQVMIGNSPPLPNGHCR